MFSQEVFSVIHGTKFGIEKHRVPKLFDGCENCVILRLLVLTQYQRVTEKWQDGNAAHSHKSLICMADARQKWCAFTVNTYKVYRVFKTK